MIDVVDRTPRATASYDERRAWLKRLYREVADLVDRYPAALAGRIRSDWWERAQEREYLAVLCAQRTLLDLVAHAVDIDGNGADPDGYLQLCREHDYLDNLPTAGDYLARQSPADAFDAGRDGPRFVAWLDAADHPALSPARSDEPPPDLEPRHAPDGDEGQRPRLYSFDNHQPLPAEEP